MLTASPLREAELLAQVHDAIDATDAQGILHTWNAGAERIYGYSAAEVLGKHVTMLCFPEDVPFLMREVFGPLATRDVHEITVRNRRKDGAEIFVALRLSVLRDSKGNIEHIIACSNDITPLRRMKEAVLMDNAPDAIVRLDREMRYLYVNAKIEQVSGLPRTAFIGKTPTEVGMPEHLVDLWTKTARSVFQTGEAAVIEFVFPSAGGATQWEGRDIPEFSSDGSVRSVLSIMRDITERKRLEAISETQRIEMQALAAKLLTAQEDERKRVSRELHDDLNQRLAALILEMGAIERNPPDSAELTRRKCTELKAQVTEISDQVHRIALQLHSAGLEHFGLRATLKQECDSISDWSGIHVRFRACGARAKIPEDLSLCLYRVAQECLRNVVKHSKAKTASVTLICAREYIRLRVADEGIGFDPGAARTGVTLGLTSMNERLRQLDGTLKLDSSPGRGTRVEAWVPLKLK